MASISFRLMATATYATKRNATTSGVTTKAASKLTGVKGTPLMPVTPEIIERYQIQSPRQTFVVYVEGTLDILNGDILVFESVDYPVRGIGPWPTDKAFLETIVEVVK
jgi:hypothetical protein